MHDYEIVVLLAPAYLPNRPPIWRAVADL